MSFSITVKQKLFDLSTPRVMGILNATPDSFYAGSRARTEKQIALRTNQIVEQGGTMIDVGAFSTRPGAEQVSQEEEMKRLRKTLAVVCKEQPEAIISVDTFRPDVAQMCVEEFGVDIINDVSDGGLTGVANVPLEPEPGELPQIFHTVARLGVPYILMSVQPTLRDVLLGFARKVSQLRTLGVKDIILDPGFGFGKTVEDNYLLLNEMEKMQVLDLPTLVGVSRKSMIYKTVGGNADTALNGTTVLHTIALMKGANILRVHDVKEAVEVIALYSRTMSATTP